MIHVRAPAIAAHANLVGEIAFPKAAPCTINPSIVCRGFEAGQTDLSQTINAKHLVTIDQAFRILPRTHKCSSCRLEGR